MDALDLRLALGRAPGLSAGQLQAAIAALAGGGLEGLIGLSVRRLEALGLPAAAAAALAAPGEASLAADRACIERERIVLLDALDPLYPPLLRQLTDAPALLYIRGGGALSSPQLAIVGSRSPTVSGRQTAQAFAAYLAQAGLTITSGLALGIDAAAHEGVLSVGGCTIAVLASGLDRIYPAEHEGLAERIVAGGGTLLSELPPGAPPRRANFLRRNRLIAGLSMGTLVVEASRYSGSLTTARRAADQGREVFAIPGSIHNPLAHGCHALIKAGARLVDNAAEVLEELHIPQRFQGVASVATPQDRPPSDRPGRDPPEGAPHSATLDKEYKILLDALGFEPAGVDQLIERSGLSSPAVASMLLILELEGAVQLQSDGRYARLPTG